ncbi:MAG: tRNA guanosine(34) transglycosylase Tgt [Phycisphaerae bacterium]|nr:tRNA guanosine(34) transglycosylase Tgt [Phycisphaerae bacterium]
MACFELLSTDPNCSARRGVLTTAHGQVQTPAFMPVGTVGAVKGVTPDQLEATGAQILLANTYHMLLRPGVEVVEKLGSLHGLMAWNRPILTDSGGYQVFSLNALTKIDDEGVRFASHLDGAPIHLNAEIATQIQFRLGADIIMCFDECTPFPVEEEHLRRAVARTLDWAKRCKTAHAKLAKPNVGANAAGPLGPISTDPRTPSLLFGIVQGGIDPQLRRLCAERIVDIGFDGYAIGGLSVGEGHEQMAETVRHTTPCLPVEAPRYLMGVGMPVDILVAVLAGVDMFDCVLPTRNGRNAFAFTRHGSLRLRNSAHIDSREPLEADCDCYCCQHFSRGALRHYFNSGEMLGPILLSIHNLRFYQRLMADVRGHIERGDFAAWAAGEMGKYAKIEAGQ